MAKRIGAVGKRPAQDDLATPNPKKIEVTASVPAAPTPLDVHQETARRIDAYFDTQRERERDEALKDPHRKLRWNIDIKPDDDEYMALRAEIHKNLAEGTVYDVLNEYLEEAQKLLIQPPARDGITLQIQNENGERYAEALAPGGAFHGQKDNLSTKLTMLVFGLPIAAMTLNNVLNAGVKDEDDAEDTPEDLPRIQRIMYSEKPLDFLDMYYERSFGFPMLRRPKSRILQGLGPPVEVPKPFLQNPQHGSATRIRGGSGPPKSRIYVYGPGNLRSTLPRGFKEDYPTFKTHALKLLGLNDTSDWEFVVDQYNNQELKRDIEQKDYQRSFVVKKDNGQFMWDNYLKTRCCNIYGDWPLVVNPVRPAGVAAPSTFKLPMKDGVYTAPAITVTSAPTAAQKAKPITFSQSQPTINAPAKKPPITSSGTEIQPQPKSSQYSETKATTVAHPPFSKKVPTGKPDSAKTLKSPVKTTSEQSANKSAPVKTTSGSSKKSPSKAKVTEKVLTLPVYTRKGRYHKRPLFTYHPEATAWDLLHVEDHVEAVIRTVQQLLELEDDEDLSFCVDLYARATPDEHAEFTLQRSETFTQTSFINQFSNVRTYLFDHRSNWSVAVRHPANRAPLTQEWPGEDFIYGYRGRVSSALNKVAFLRSAYQLLFLMKGTNWTFTIDLHGTKPGELKSVDVTETTFEAVFDTEVHPLRHDQRPFLRFSTQPVASELAPDHDANIIGLSRNSFCTAYWKVPADLTPVYGINQCQQSFSNAMQVLFPPGSARRNHDFHHPAQNIYVGEHDIGWGGMEVTPELWKDVKRNEKSEDYRVTLRPAGDNDDGSTLRTGVRLAGSHHLGEAKLGDYDQIYKEIAGLASSWLASKPKSVRVWKHAWARENGEDLLTGSENVSAVIPLQPKAAALNVLRRLFSKDPNQTTCVWFRPEWETIEVRQSDGNNRTVDWHPEHGSELSNFKEDILKRLGYDGKTSFSVVDTHESQKFHVYVGGDLLDGEQGDINPDDDWRIHIFDWFHSSKIEVKLLDDKGIDYVLDDTAWGVIVDSPPAVPQAQRPLRQIDSRGPRLNNARILAPRAAPIKTEKFKDWSEKQTFENGRQIRSYLVDQSAVEPGHKPQPPIYGHSREIMHLASDALPSLYCERITPTDISRTIEEKKYLQNQVLERQATCPICTVSLEKYKTDEISDHYNRHVKQIQAAGACPICETEQWMLWTPEERKLHLDTHTDASASKAASDFWDSLFCPVCDIQLDTLGNTKAILYHMAEHTPGILEYCDRCGLNIKSCDQVEIDHHHLECATKPDRALTEPTPIFCDTCGKNRSKRSKGEEIVHRRYCKLGLGAWCEVCSIELTGWAPDGVSRHKSHCKTPGGFDRKFCSRCGINLAVMDDIGISYHQQTCFNNDNKYKSTDQRTQKELDFQRMTVELADAKAKNHSKQNILDRRNKELGRLRKEYDVKAAALELKIASSGKGSGTGDTQVRKQLHKLQHEFDEQSQLVEDLRQKEKDLLEQNEAIRASKTTPGPLVVPDYCPFPDCKEDISVLNGQEQIDHVLSHADEADHSFAGIPMKQPRKVRNTRAVSSTPATTKRKRVTSATPGPDDGPVLKTPKRGRPSRKALIQEEEEEFNADEQEEESELPLTSPSKRVTRRSPSKRV